MDEELTRWTSEWKAQEVRPMRLVARHSSAHQAEAVSFAAMALAFGLGAVAVVLGFGWLASRLPLATPPRIALFGVAGADVVGGALMLLMSWRRRTSDEAKLTDSPRSVAASLIALRKRELFWWLSKPVLIGTGAWLLVQAGIVVWAGVTDAASGLPTAHYWVSAVLGPTVIVGLTVFGVHRVRFLEADVAALERLLEEMSE